MHQSKLAWLGFCVALVTGCDGSDPDGSGGAGGTVGAAGPVEVNGAAHKGPLVLGSSVQVAMLDAVGNPTGQVFNTTTDNDLGQFELVVATPGDAELIANGFYFNEASGELSGAPITLHALAAITSSGSQSSYLNIVTHMGYRRAMLLRRAGTRLPEAVAQAETELRTALGIVHPSPTPGVGTSMNILGGDTPDNQYVFALSCVLAAASGSDAELQELLNGVAVDLEPDGELAAALVQRLVDAEKSFDPAVCVANMEARIQSTGSNTVVPDISQVWDTDKDGEPNAADDDDDGDNAPDAQDCAALNPEVAGAWCDALSGLCWSPVTAVDHMILWSEAGPACDALSICGEDDWRLPTISEFRTFIRGCPANEAGGSCGVTDQCASEACLTDCNDCTHLGGPSTNGCYFDPAISMPADMPGGCGEFWSATPLQGAPTGAWWVEFCLGAIWPEPEDMPRGASGVLCVRSGS